MCRNIRMRIGSLVTTAQPKDREAEAQCARERSRVRSGMAGRR